MCVCVCVYIVPGVPEDFNVTEVIEDDLVGLMMSWSMVDGLVDSYRLNINRMNKGDTVIVGAINSEVIITSEELGGYERVNIQVSAVNNAGYGPLSNILNIRTPAIGKLVYLFRTSHLPHLPLPPSLSSPSPPSL